VRVVVGALEHAFLAAATRKQLTLVQPQDRAEVHSRSVMT
jgi:hypothetical protein